MASVAHTSADSRWAVATRVAAALRTEVGLARLGLGLVSLHVVDDNFLQPNPGTSAGDHLVSGLVPLALLVAAAIVYPRLRAGARATIALLAGFFGVLAGTEAVVYTRTVGASGDDYSGLLSVPAGFLLIGLGAVTLWRSRRTDDRPWWRYLRRLLLGGSSVRPRVRRPLPVLDRVRRHACGTRNGSDCRPRRSLRERGVQDGRRAAPEGLVHPVAERSRGHLVPGPRLLPETGQAARSPRLWRPAVRSPRRGQERGGPQHLRLAGRAGHPCGGCVPAAAEGRRSPADRWHRALRGRRDADRGGSGVR